ncbi:MAG: DNA polymerase I [Gammaproteobacteria bacterium]|nr:DNA polymerase I [Gammaproteobacteria bacterium]MDH3505506.1 DNA polymerase I [Gammaproteobacteria bacterium]
MSKKKTSKNKPLVLVDGSSYLFRAFHATQRADLRTSSGEPTGAIMVVLNMLYKLLDDYAPEHVAVVFDAPGKTFRDDLYADYKGNRPPMPDDLRPQIEPLLEAIEANGIPLIRIEGVEADDVIGTLAREASKQGLETVISTSDKDMAQLVDDDVTLLDTMSDTKLDADGVKAKFGVTPEQIIDFLALTGDTSDNIPGVPGVGPKTAAKWLAEYGTLEAIIENADAIPGKAGENLRATLEQLPLYRQLTTIVCDLELDVEPNGLRIGEPDEQRLLELYKRLELSSLLRRVDRKPEDDTPRPDVSYETVLTETALRPWLERVEKAKLVALDTETTSLDYMEAEIVGISLCVEPGTAAYIPLAHSYPGAPEQLDRESVLERMRPWLESDAPKLGHHLKYDAHIFANHGIKLGGMAYDSMLESFVLNSTATRHDLDSVAAKYLEIKTTKYEEVAGKGVKQLRFDEVDIDTAAPYAAEDADVSLRLHEMLWARLEQAPELRRIYEDVEQPLVPVLQKMEYLGVLVDAQMLREQSQELAAKMLETETEAHKEAGGPFNLASPKQLQEILYERLGLPVLGKTPKGQPSTAESVLQELAADYELPRLVLEHRALAKLKSTYTDKLPAEINPRTGRIHTSYHQAVAATGRLSSSDPNLQNIPIRTPEGRRIRQAFVAPEGYRLLAADYSQIELRIMAHLSQDEGLLAAFAADQDIHTATAAEVFGRDLDSVTANERRSAKAINFGLMYGMSAFGLARQLGIERGEAQSYVDLYFSRYPGVKRYMDETRKQAREQGYVSTVLGRRLYLPEIDSRNHQRRQYAERSAINAPMQGTAADIIKRAMIDVDRWLTESGADARLIMQVHDELVLEVEAGTAAKLAEEISARMESAASLRVPLKVDFGLGSNWDEAH